MKTLSFLVKGRSSNPYEVQFFRDDNSTNMTALCTCRAATFGNFCKHRIQLITGNSGGLVSDNANEISQIAKMVQGTDVEAALKDYFIKEEACNKANAEFKEIKKQLTAAMHT